MRMCLKQIAIAALLLLLLTWLAFRSTSSTAHSVQLTLNVLDEVAAAESALHRDLLGVRTGLLNNYDPIVAETKIIRDAIPRLKANAPADPQIAKQNAGVTLPSSKITVVHRSDESGTTKAFLSYVGAYSKKWENGPGVDKSVKWPTGTGAKGNDGVAAAIKQTPNSIGYVEQAYARNNDFTYASLKNKAGN